MNVLEVDIVILCIYIKFLMMLNDVYSVENEDQVLQEENEEEEIIIVHLMNDQKIIEDILVQDLHLQEEEIMKEDIHQIDMMIDILQTITDIILQNIHHQNILHQQKENILQNINIHLKNHKKEKENNSMHQMNKRI